MSNTPESLFKSLTNENILKVEKFPSSGSNRKYSRIIGENSTIVSSIGTSVEENKAFISLSRHFKQCGLNVPLVLAHSEDYKVYLQEDLGNLSLFDALSSSRNKEPMQYSKEDKDLLFKTIKKLPQFQFEGARNLDFSVCYPQSEFDERTIINDCNYFKYCFLKPSGVDFNENKLDNDFYALSAKLLEEPTDTFMYRDFQSRNVMIKNGEPYFIDFQGGRKGPIYYDLASFVWQARSKFPISLKEELVMHYVEALKKYEVVDNIKFRKRLSYFVLFRMLQTLGAYGYRGWFERKKHFLDSIPFALENLREYLSENTQNLSFLPYLKTVLLSMIETLEQKFNEKDKSENISSLSPAKNEFITPNMYGEDLTVRINSFSYMKGIPEDNSGNGGGYVFDCRGMHNPGRYEIYRSLTGMDTPVIDFLERIGEIEVFMDAIYKLSDPHVECYIRRGFTSLMFSFGCTGGRHRSVYAAEHLAAHISEKYGVRIILEHREQNIKKIIASKKVPLHTSADLFAPRTAFVLAAGLGTRLRPITNDRPKALVKYHGKYLIEHVLNKLGASGFSNVVVNVHHFAGQIISFVHKYQTGVVSGISADMHITCSDETDLLRNTGGGIKHAEKIIRKKLGTSVNGMESKAFLVYNVDIVSNIDLDWFWARHLEYSRAYTNMLATLLVSKRKSSRYLLFDTSMRLVGWTNVNTGEIKSPFKNIDIEKCSKYAFSGIHIISSKVFDLMKNYPEDFSIIDFYLDMVSDYSIFGCKATRDFEWEDVGKINKHLIEENNGLIKF